MGAHGLANTGNFQKFFRFADQLGNRLRQRLNGFGGAAVRADAEWVVAANLHEIGGFVKDVGEKFVVHLTQFYRAAGSISRSATSRSFISRRSITPKLLRLSKVT